MFIRIKQGMFIRSLFSEKYNAIFLKSRLPFLPPASRIFLLVPVCCQKNVSFVLTKRGTYIRKSTAHSFQFYFIPWESIKREKGIQRLDTKKIGNFYTNLSSSVRFQFVTNFHMLRSPKELFSSTIFSHRNHLDYFRHFSRSVLAETPCTFVNYGEFEILFINSKYLTHKLTRKNQTGTSLDKLP